MRNTLHAEWTKFRTVRGWVAGLIVAAGAIMAFGLLPGAQGSCGQHGPESECVLPVGPDGQEVTDSFTFVHLPLTGDGSITARVTSLTGLLPSGPESEEPKQGVAPWAKAGLIIKDGTRQGAAYAAVMVTGGHGVRMQHNYAHDRAGKPGTGSELLPQWLRLTRAGETITAEESADGTQWTVVGAVRLAGLPSTVEAGIFATSPQFTEGTSESLGLSGAAGGPTQVTATFDRIDRKGAWGTQDWAGGAIGGPSNAWGLQVGSYEKNGDGFTVSGSGDIAPAVAGASGMNTITQTLVGTFIGLIVMVVIGTMFSSGEYRRGLIRTSLSASPRRTRNLIAKAMVIGAVTFVTGLIAAAVVVVFGQEVLRDNGVYIHPATTSTELRVIAGTAALLAVASILGLALGFILRRSTTAVTTAIVTIVLPYLLALTVLPAGAAQWLLRISPAAAFALQQSVEQYDQVASLYTPVNGYFPLPPWAGFGVLAAWTALALALAAYLLRRRDA